MFDIHLPHKAAENLKEFCVHIVTISIGLLIALGIEAAVEARHHEHLAQEARTMFREEIKDNAHRLDEALKGIEEQRKDIQESIHLLEKIQEDDKGPEAALQEFKIPGPSRTQLPSTALRTAQSTGAFAYMSYSEAERYSSLYELQEWFAAEQQLTVEDFSKLLGFARKTHTRKGSRTSSAEASAAAEILGVWQAHLLQLDLITKLVSDHQHAFLEGREPKKGMSADFDFK